MQDCQAYCHIQLTAHCTFTVQKINIDYYHSISIDTCFICEDNKATITCSENPETTLNITSANYGRTADNICRHPFKPSDDTDCETFEATFEKVKDDCQERVECELHANSKRFSDTCSGTYKYLEVNFACRIYGKYCVISEVEVSHMYVHVYFDKKDCRNNNVKLSRFCFAIGIIRTRTRICMIKSGSGLKMDKILIGTRTRTQTCLIKS